MAEQSNIAMDTTNASASYSKQGKREHITPESSPDGSVKDKVRKIERNLEDDFEPGDGQSDAESGSESGDNKSDSKLSAPGGFESRMEAQMAEMMKAMSMHASKMNDRMKDMTEQFDVQSKMSMDRNDQQAVCLNKRSDTLEQLLKDANEKMDQMDKCRKADLIELKTLRTDYNSLLQEYNALKQSVNGQLKGFSDRVKTLEDNVLTSEDLTPFVSRLKTVENQASSRESVFPALIVKGLVENTAENDDSLRRSCQDMIDSIQVAARVQTATRVGSTAPGSRKPRLVKMSIRSMPDLKLIMKNKRKLDSNSDYKEVFIEPDKPENIRRIENNIRLVVREMPDLEYKQGKLSKKSQGHDGDGENDDRRGGDSSRRGGRRGGRRGDGHR